MIVAALCVALMSSPPRPDFVENFRLRLPRSTWEYVLNGGTARWNGKEFQMVSDPSQTGFPCIWSRPEVLPKSINFTVEICYRIPKVGPYGTGVSVESHDGKTCYARVHADTALNGALLVAGNNHQRVTNPEKWHFLVVSKEGGKWAVSHDNDIVSTFTRDDVACKIVLGNNAANLKPWDFSSLSLQHVKVQYTK